MMMWSCVTMQAQEWWQITPWAPNQNYIMGALPSGEATWVHKDSVAAPVKVKNSPTMLLRIENDSIRADIRKKFNRDTIGGQRVFLSLRVDSTGQLLGYDEILSDDFDDDPYNEFQTLSSNGLPGHISLSDGGQEYINVNDADASPTNEIQTLSRSGNNISISGGNTVSIADGDSNPNNELQTLYIDSTSNRIFNIGLSPDGGIVYFKDSTGLTGVQIGNIISDSLALITTEPDSIQRVGNVISLRDGDGSVDISDKQDALVSGTNIKTVNGNSLLGSGNVSVGTVTSITASAPLTGGTITSTGSIGADTTSTTGLGTNYKLSLKQDKLSGANKRIPYFTGTSTLSNSDNLSYDDKKLGIGTISPQATLDLSSSGGNSIRFYDSAAGTNYKEWKIQIGNDGREMNFISRSDLGSEYNFMTFNRATNSQIMANWYAPFISSTVGTGDNVMTINEVGSIYRSPLKTINSASLFGSGDISLFTLPSLTSGSVLFSNGTTIAQDNSNFFWDNTNKRMGIGTNSPQVSLHSAGNIRSAGNSAYTGNFPTEANLQIGSSSFGVAQFNNGNTVELAFMTYGNTAFTVDGFNGLNSFKIPHGSNSSGYLQVSKSPASTNSSYWWQARNDAMRIVSYNLSNGMDIGTTGQNLRMSTSYGNAVGLYMQGNTQEIGIKTSSPSTDFDVNGRVRIRTTSGTATTILGRDQSGNVLDYPITANITGSGEVGRIAIWSSATNVSFNTNLGADQSGGAMRLQSYGGLPLLLNALGNNIGIGNITPTASFDVNGSVRLRTLSGSGDRILFGSAVGDLGASQVTRSDLGLGFGVASASITHAIHMASGNSIRLQTGANIVDKNNSGGANGYVLQATGGLGVQWVSTSGIFTEVDGDLANEGFLGVGSSGTNQSLLQGYNSAGTTTGTGVTFQAQQSITMTETTSTNGGTINVGLSRPYAHLRQTGFSTTQNLSANTWTKINFENIQNSNGYTANTTNEDVTIGSNNTGIAECTFTGYFTFPTSPNTGWFEVALFKNGTQINQTTVAYLLSEAGRYWSVPISWTENFSNTTDTIDVRVKSTSAMTGLVAGAANFIVQRIN